MIFLNVEKVFDRVWHEELLHKLYQMATPITLISLIKSFKIAHSKSKLKTPFPAVGQSRQVSHKDHAFMPVTNAILHIHE